MTPDQVITVRLDAAQLRFIRENAKKAEIGGRSNIRGRQERMESLGEDQLIGQVGLFVGNYWLSGSDTAYLTSRWFQNMFPRRGDRGGDVPGANVDFKCSLMRAGKDPMEYRLLVRPRERHPGWVYVLALVESLDDDGAVVHLVGWMEDGELPQETATGGPFAGAHVVKAENLHPLPPLTWWR